MDQVLVQRAFAAKNLNEDERRHLAGASNSSFPSCWSFPASSPGLVAELPNADQAYPKLLGAVMPHGLLGLTVAGISAALMGHMSATFNSISTMFTRDLYMRVRPKAEPKTQILVGRLAVAAVALMAPLGADHRKFGSLWTISNRFRSGWSCRSPASSSSGWPGNGSPRRASGPDADRLRHRHRF